MEHLSYNMAKILIAQLVSDHIILMAQKMRENRVEAMENELEVKSEIQCLSGLEKSVENITQTMAKILQSMEDTQKAWQPSLILKQY